MNEHTLRVYQGGCLCSAVRYEVEGQPLVVAHCHCESCQRGSGAGHSTGAMFPADKFKLSGPIAEYKYKSNNGNEVTRFFCPACGSPVFGRNSGAKDYVTVTLGTIDNSNEFEPQVVVFARNQKLWDVIEGNLPTFDAQPDWKPKEDE
ncbi:MAG: aldehyde-activating protein [Rhodospirillaceae bacterium]|nr:MAG: aldehyde-activating protein [Rhodospirillaceae bacterium]